jgi:UDP:flavonoid glycosyltransferase YjiC (YdhE family)
MSDVLFVTWDGGGNVAPAFEIANHLVRQGHAVRFLGQSQQRQFFERGGFAFSAYTHPGPWTASGRRGALKNAFGFLSLLTGRSLGRDLIAEVRARPVDLVVIDCLLFGALDAAASAGLRRAVLVHSLYEAIDSTMASGAPGIVARVRGLRPRELWGNADLVIVATLRKLDRVRPEVASSLRYTGPALPEVAPPEPWSAHPRILVSLSTTYLPKQASVLQRVMDALADLPVSVVVTTGPAVDPLTLRPPANAEVHAYLPHADVMRTVSLVIGHGGHSTTMLALANGLPLLVMPMNLVFDQVRIGKAIQRVGAGLTIAAGSPASEIRSAVERILASDSFTREAARLGGVILNEHGARAAAALLLAAISTSSSSSSVG